MYSHSPSQLALECLAANEGLIRGKDPSVLIGFAEVRYDAMDSAQTKAHFSLPSIIAVVAAIGSFFVGAFGGFVLALMAIVFGIAGVLLSLAPSVRGGFISILSLIVAAIGIVVAAIKAIAWVI